MSEGARAGVSLPGGIKRATAFPRLRITKDRPDSVSRNSSERRVLASNALTSACLMLIRSLQGPLPPACAVPARRMAPAGGSHSCEAVGLRKLV